MKKVFLKYGASLASVLLALLLCVGYSGSAYERVFTHSHGPLHEHSHQHSGDHHHSGNEAPASENAKPQLFATSLTAKSGKTILPSADLFIVVPMVVTSLLGISPINHDLLRLPRLYELPPRIPWLLVSLSLAPNSPPQR